VILPLEPSGKGERLGFVVAGLSALLADGASYTRFHNLLVASLSQAVSSAVAREQELERAEALAELNQQKTVFFSSVSHEISHPFDSDARAHGGRAGREVAQLGGEALQLVHRNARRLLKLVNTLLDFSRIEAGRVDARFQSDRSGRVTAALASSFRSLVEQAGLRLLVTCPPLPELAYVDKELWEKIVLNLISNAFKFTLEGSIEVSLKALGGWVGCAWPIPVRASRSRAAAPVSTLSAHRRGQGQELRRQRHWSGAGAGAGPAARGQRTGRKPGGCGQPLHREHPARQGTPTRGTRDRRHAAGSLQQERARSLRRGSPRLDTRAGHPPAPSRTSPREQAPRA
jgi:hypothetical protein